MDKWPVVDRIANTASMIGFVVESLTVIIGLYYTVATLREGNRIAWQSYIDGREAENARNILDHEALRCVYRYRLHSIDGECPDKVYANLSQAAEYVSQQIEVLTEAKEYDVAELPGFYAKWYGGVARDLAEDPSGIVSFVLWNYYNCKSETNCKIAADLGICIADENFVIDKSRCFTNLIGKRDKLFRAVNEPMP
jgi:hypothetical protein